MFFCRRLEWLRLFGAVLLACVFVQFAAAQEHYPPEHLEWDVAWFGGTSIGETFHFPTTVLGGNNSNTVGMRFGSGYQLGVRVHENLRKYWGADLEYSAANQPLTLTNLSPDIQSLSLSQTVHHFSYGLSFLPLRPQSRFRPYASAQAGAALYFLHKSSRYDALDRGLGLHDDWKFLVNWGGGFKYLFTDEFGFEFDVKDQMTGIPTYGLPETARIVNGRFRPGVSRHGLFNNWQFNIGFSYQWDD